MTMPKAPADTSPAASIAASSAVSAVRAPPSWPWRRAALFLAGAAQLITISALVGADPLAATWWSLLLAIARHRSPQRRRSPRRRSTGWLPQPAC